MKALAIGLLLKTLIIALVLTLGYVSAAPQSAKTDELRCLTADCAA